MIFSLVLYLTPNRQKYFNRGFLYHNQAFIRSYWSFHWRSQEDNLQLLATALFYFVMRMLANLRQWTQPFSSLRKFLPFCSPKEIHWSRILSLEKNNKPAPAICQISQNLQCQLSQFCFWAFFEQHSSHIFQIIELLLFWFLVCQFLTVLQLICSPYRLPLAKLWVYHHQQLRQPFPEIFLRRERNPMLDPYFLALHSQILWFLFLLKTVLRKIDSVSNFHRLA